MRSRFKPTIDLLLRNRTPATLFAILFLLIMVSIIPVFLPLSSNPAALAIYTAAINIVTNMLAAFFWYSILVAHQRLEATEPVVRLFPFLRNKLSEVVIILASLPSTLGHEITGSGEARALGIILERFSSCRFPPEKIITRFAGECSEDEIAKVLATKDVIILGGPNFNKCADMVIARYWRTLKYIFSQDYKVNGDPRRYSGAIVENLAGPSRVITRPLPESLTTDLQVTRDCGLIFQTKNENGKQITLMAGGMTNGVWLAAKLMTDNSLIESWYHSINPDEENSAFEVIFECPMLHLSAQIDQLRILDARRIGANGGDAHV